MEDVKNSLYLCRKIGFILIHFVNSSFESQERRMGHGKSRPLRNLSKKKGFRILNNNVKKDYEVVKKITNYK